ncbi:MAG: Bax inhibitor-1/YccA family protein [Actinomycetaceae bacterium]|nr:Bax inhibitor-1/YccA family protein [Actinomycetaceae bacterium]
MSRLDQEFAQRTPAGYPTMPGYTPGRGQGAPTMGRPYAPTSAPSGYETAAGRIPMEEYEQAYAGRDAGPVQTGRMTYDDVIVKTGAMFGLVLAGAILGWMAIGMAPGLGLALVFGGMIASLVLAMVNIFSKKIRPALISAYAVAEGLMLGGFSWMFELMYPGIVMQAVIATFAVMGVALALFASGKVRYSSKTSRFVLIGLFSILGYNLLNMVLVWTGVLDTAWGLGSITIAGIPLGLIVGVFAVIVGTYSLIGDFDVAKRGVEAGAPRIYAWSVAFGITVTAVWIYVEVLRLIAIFRSVVGNE